MACEYVPIFFDWIDVTEELNAEERGRLINAIVMYASGRDWQSELVGNERFLFPAFRRQIERANDISAKRSAAGSTGQIKSDQTKANANKTRQTETNPSKPKQAETSRNKTAKEYNNKKEEEEEKEYKADAGGNNTAAAAAGHCFGEDLREEDITASLANDRMIEDAARDWGLPCAPGNIQKARDLAREYSIQWLIEAMKRAGNGKSQTWAYVEGILRSFRRNGGPDTPRAGTGVVYPEKKVSAQRYQQRQYTEEELLAVSDDLMQEAKTLQEAMPKQRSPEEQARYEKELNEEVTKYANNESVFLERDSPGSGEAEV